MVDLALRASGLRVGRYTSPPLINLEERSRSTANRSPCRSSTGDRRDARPHRSVARGRNPRRAAHAPRSDDGDCAGAVPAGRRHIAVLEVGLGGALDSTNSVDPVAVAVSRNDFDHEQYLGTTLAAIAAEKAGVIRAGIPVDPGPLVAEARRVVVSACETAGARFVDADNGVQIDSTSVEAAPLCESEHRSATTDGFRLDCEASTRCRRGRRRAPARRAGVHRAGRDTCRSHRDWSA